MSTISASKKAKILWQCRRGMLELDLMLGSFVEKKCDALTEIQQTALESLLSLSDPMLYALLMGHEISTDEEIARLVAAIQLERHTA